MESTPNWAIWSYLKTFELQSMNFKIWEGIQSSSKQFKQFKAMNRLDSSRWASQKANCTRQSDALISATTVIDRNRMMRKAHVDSSSREIGNPDNCLHFR